jgi:hypothetical protein
VASKPFLWPSTGYFTAEPSFGSGGEVGITLHEVAAFTVAYANDDPDDFAITSVQPVTVGWDGIEHVEQLILMPSGLFLDRRGMVGDRNAAIARFRQYRQHGRDSRPGARLGHRYARYRADILLDHGHDRPGAGSAKCRTAPTC